MAETSPSDSAARANLFVALGFLLLAAGAWSLAQLKLAFPSFIDDAAILSYGRLRPLAMNASVFGWVTFAGIGAAYYLLPRLTGVQLFQARLAQAFTPVTAVVAAVHILSPWLGFSEGRELLEAPWYLDIALIGVLSVPTVLVTRTLLDRSEPTIFITLWYVVAGLYWLVGTLVISVIPGLTSVASALQGAFAWSSLLGLWVLGLGVGLGYYVILRETDQPLFSRTLAQAGFWTLAVAQAWVGPVRLVYGPAPDWLETVAVTLSVALFVGAVAVATNYVRTIEGAWDRVSASPALQFTLLGMVGYLVIAALWSISAFRSVAAVVGLTQWWDGISYGIVMFTGLALLAGFYYHAIPRLLGRELHSHDLARANLRLHVVGIGGSMVLLLIAGLVAGFTWAGGAYSGLIPPAGESFSATTDAVGLLWSLLVIFGLLAAAAQLVFVNQMYRTFTSGAPAAQEVLVAAGGAGEEDADDE